MSLADFCIDFKSLIFRNISIICSIVRAKDYNVKKAGDVFTSVSHMHKNKRSFPPIFLCVCQTNFVAFPLRLQSGDFKGPFSAAKRFTRRIINGAAFRGRSRRRRGLFHD